MTLGDDSAPRLYSETMMESGSLSNELENWIWIRIRPLPCERKKMWECSVQEQKNKIQNLKLVVNKV